MKTLRLICLSAAMAAACLPTRAQPVVGRLLADASFRQGDNCAVVEISFNAPVRYLNHFPIDQGDQLSIRLGPIASSTAMSQSRESLKPPASAVSDIEYDGTAAGGPLLSLQFSQKVSFAVEQGGDFRSLVVTIGAPGGAACPAAPQQKAEHKVEPTGPTAPISPPGAVLALPKASAAAQKMLDDARAAITSADYPTAIALLTKLLQEPESSVSPDAQELLGVAREKNGQAAHAKAEYDAYLKRYPSGEGADRVRQRLASLLNRALKPTQGTATAQEGEPSAVAWTFSGSASEYYYHDEMSIQVKDETNQVVIDSGVQTLQSELVSAFDGSLQLDAGDYEGAIRASLAYTKDFVTASYNRLSVSSLYLEAGTGDHNWLLRAGRQYRNTGGIFGRIDGLLVSGRINDEFKIDLIGGYPVDSSWSKVQSHRQAYGGSLVYSSGAWGGDVYFLRQTDAGLLDREAIGLEAHYVGKTMAVFSTFDYDIHFGEVNLALINANFTFPDQTTLNLAADYRRAPLLRTSDALIGQTVPTLTALLSTYSLAEIQQLALDRTSRSTSFFASINHPLDQQFSVGFDATLWSMTGSPASGGVPALPSIGLETYFAAHVIGTDLIADGDLGMINLGYAKTFNANRYTIDLNTRYPITRELRIGPRIFAGYRTTTDTNTSQLSIRPTLRLNYRIGHDAEFELEAGAEYQKDRTPFATTTSWNYLITAGVRIDF